MGPEFKKMQATAKKSLPKDVSPEQIKELEVKVFGQNSLYIIYAQKGDKQLSISPIQDNIKKIENPLIIIKM